MAVAGPTPRPSRRAFLAGVAAVAGLAGCAPAVTGGRPVPVPVDPVLASGARRPNLLIIVSDDHRWDHMSCVPNHPPFLRTPALDQLAARGTLGANAFVTTALCSPSRASFLSGEYASRHGVMNNLTPWNPQTQTFFEQLMAAGYDNAFIGKWHMPGAVPDLRGVDRFITFTAEEGQGKYIDCPLLIDGVMTPRPDTYISTDLTDLAIEWIDERPNDKPWCLWLAHKAVHHQWIPPADLAGSLNGVDFSNLPPESFALLGALDRNIWEGSVGSMYALYQRYCETLMGLDREIGRLINRVDQRGETDSTFVVYTSDNGYSWGEHVLTGKRWAYEENTRVPFLVAGPGIGMGTTDKLLLNVDLAPTVLEWGRAAELPAAQGRSLVNVLTGANDLWRRDFLYQYFPDFPYNVPGISAARDEQWLYITYARGLAPQLFDVRADPLTQMDLIDAEPAVARRMQQRLGELESTVASGGIV